MSFNRIIKHFLLIVICIASSSCSNQIENLPDFDQVVEVEGVEVFGDILGKIFLHKINDGIMISTLNEDSLYTYLEPRGNIKFKFGNVGSGPNEIPYPIYIYDSDGDSFFIYSSQYAKLHKIILPTHASDKSFVINKSYSFPRELTGINTVFFASDSLLTGSYDDHFSMRLDQRRGIFTYNPKDSTYQNFELENLSVTPYEPRPMANINAKMVDFNSTKEKLVIASVHAPIIEVFSLINNRTNKISLFDDYQTSYEIETFEEDNVTQYFLFVEATDDYIYTLYSGSPLSESDGSRNIFIFDWDFNPVKKLIIDSSYHIDSFTVDEENDIIYGHSLDTFKAYKFEI